LAEVRPFRGLRYALPDEELGRCLAPPYDVISPGMQRELTLRHPHNIVRCVLSATPGEGAYPAAREELERLRREGALREEEAPCHYLLEQVFPEGGSRLTRWGLLTRFRPEDPRGGRILPHEKTRSAPKEDRYKLLLATRANFSPIFLMFEDRGAFQGLVEGSPKDLLSTTTDDEGVLHRLYRVADRQAQVRFEELLAEGRSYIADGHHRYATALRYRDSRGGDQTFGYFTPLGGEGLLVRPYHRLLGGLTLAEVREALDPHFEWREVPSPRDLLAAVAGSRATYAFGLCDRESGALALSRSSFGALLPADQPDCLRALDTFALHRGVLAGLLGRGEEGVRYCHTLGEVLSGLREGSGVGVLMRPTTVRQIVDVADAGESMPPKSTFFFPKIPSGLVIHPLP
jgi:uncharacterized protein (DUF1015 family)